MTKKWMLLSIFFKNINTVGRVALDQLLACHCDINTQAIERAMTSSTRSSLYLFHDTWCIYWSDISLSPTSSLRVDLICFNPLQFAIINSTTFTQIHSPAWYSLEECKPVQCVHCACTSTTQQFMPLITMLRYPTATWSPGFETRIVDEHSVFPVLKQRSFSKHGPRSGCSSTTRWRPPSNVTWYRRSQTTCSLKATGHLA